MDETRWILYLGHSKWTICYLLSWSCPKNFQSSLALYWGSHFLMPQRGENEKKGFTQKCMRHRGFSAWGSQTWSFAACWADFVPKFFNLSELYTGGSHFLLPQRVSEKNGWDTVDSILGAFKLDHLYPVKLILSKKFSIILRFMLSSHFLLPQRSNKQVIRGNDPVPIIGNCVS